MTGRYGGFLAGILGSLLLSGAAFAAPPSSEHGLALVQANCAECHAIGLEDDSPHTKAPPFRELSIRFDVETVDEMLLAQVSPPHTDMPRFTLTPSQAADIAAHIATIQPVEHGRALVEDNCAGCHATGATGDSPHTDAPPFRTLSQRYPIEALEEAFAEGIYTGHPDMPEFVVTPRQIGDIIAYLESIQEKK
jgi:cytochrome c